MDWKQKAIDAKKSKLKELRRKLEEQLRAQAEDPEYIIKKQANGWPR